MEAVRVRQSDPDLFVRQSFRNIDINTELGIAAVVGKRPGKDATEVQTFLFDKEKWSIETAKQWVEDNRATAIFYLTRDQALAIYEGKTAMAQAMGRNKLIQKNVRHALGLVQVQIDKGTIRRIQ